MRAKFGVSVVLAVLGTALTTGAILVSRMARTDSPEPQSTREVPANTSVAHRLGGVEKRVAMPSSKTTPDAATKSRISQTYARLPLSFEPNVGQTENPEVKFISRGKGYSLGLTPTGAMLALSKPLETNNQQAGDRHPRLQAPQPGILNLPSLLPSAGAGEPGNAHFAHPLPLPEKNSATQTVRMELVGASPTAQPSALEQLPGKSNYFIGNDPKKWRTNVSNYAKVKYQGVYPGIDLVYYGSERGQLEYDFVVAPGADPKRIRFEFVGEGSALPRAARGRPYISPNGDLVIATDAGDVRFHKPVVYQPVAPVSSPAEETAMRTSPLQPNPKSKIGNPKFVEGHFVLLTENRVGFEISNYDKTKSLVIDPVLSYSTYLGGSNDDIGFEVAVDSAGNAYVVGYTTSPNFPTTAGALQPTQSGFVNVFVAKLNPTGTALIYSTYLGGSIVELGLGIAVNSAGEAHVVGWTWSSDFPTTPGAFQTSLLGTQDGFVTKLDATGTGLVYSTYLGGGGSLDAAIGVTVDAAGNAYVTGPTDSTDFPVTPGAFQGTYQGGSQDAYVTELNATGSVLIHSTYLGGSAGDQSARIAVDSTGDTYVSGSTSSANFPTTAGAFQTTYAGGVTDPFGDGFVTKLNSAGTALVYSTYIGGSADDLCNFLTLDPAGNLYVSGGTASPDFPVTPGAFQTTLAGAAQPSPLPTSIFGLVEDGFVVKLNATGTTLLYSTFLGGSTGYEGIAGIRLDSSGNATVTGNTGSSDFPVTPDAIQASFGGGCQDAFVTTLNPAGSALVFSTYFGGNG